MLNPKAFNMIPHTARSDGNGHRPAYRPTDGQRDTIRVLAANGISQAIMAEVLAISVDTLQKYFRDDLESGKGRVTASIGARMVRAALDGNVNAMKFWLLTRAADQWKLPKEAIAEGIGILDGTAAEDEPWVIMMPENGRDRPETNAAPTIEGQAEAA